MKRICALAMLALLLGMLCAGGPAGVYADGAEAVSSVSAGSSADPLQTGMPFADQTAAAGPTSGEGGALSASRTAVQSARLTMANTPDASSSTETAEAVKWAETWQEAFFIQPGEREMHRLSKGIRWAMDDEYVTLGDVIEKYDVRLDIFKAWIINRIAYRYILEDYEKTGILDWEKFAGYDGLPTVHTEYVDYKDDPELSEEDKRYYYSECVFQDDRGFVVPAYSDGELVITCFFDDPYPVVEASGQRPEELEHISSGSSYIYFVGETPASGEPRVWQYAQEAFEAAAQAGLKVSNIYAQEEEAFWYRVKQDYYNFRCCYYSEESGGLKRIGSDDDRITFTVLQLKTDKGPYVYRVPEDEYWGGIGETHELFTMEEYLMRLAYEKENAFLEVKPTPTPTPTPTPAPAPSPTLSPTPATVRTPRPGRTTAAASRPAPAETAGSSEDNQTTVSPVLSPSAFTPSKQGGGKTTLIVIGALMAVLAVGAACWAAVSARKRKMGK